MVYLIGYDLNKTDKNYDGVYTAIKESSVSGSTWWHYLDSTWIIKSNLTVDQVQEKIKLETDENDHFLVIEVKNNKQGWLPKDAWDYLNNNIFI
ncbi:hypothetical protein [Clostridium sp. CF012]|uniref:hypothetical protein n=1 Tax=Clostridium sp. CF012 TaxID=2843319 RepID=UPI001C0B06CF|nr:hypothetical protein [Clostridium sp. CF012]MBU3146838.1 hypothetical protein [Clostridium sp. CF012]